MQTFIVVVCKCLPVVVSLHAPGMIESILCKVKLLEAFLCINSKEVVVPRSSGFSGGVQIDPYESKVINMDMNWKEAVLFLHKVREGLKMWRFSQLSIDSVGPAMVFAGKDLHITRILVS